MFDKLNKQFFCVVCAVRSSFCTDFWTGYKNYKPRWRREKKLARVLWWRLTCSLSNQRIKKLLISQRGSHKFSSPIPKIYNWRRNQPLPPSRCQFLLFKNKGGSSLTFNSTTSKSPAIKTSPISIEKKYTFIASKSCTIYCHNLCPLEWIEKKERGRERRGKKNTKSFLWSCLLPVPGIIILVGAAYMGTGAGSFLQPSHCPQGLLVIAVGKSYKTNSNTHKHMVKVLVHGLSCAKTCFLRGAVTQGLEGCSNYWEGNGQEKVTDKDIICKEFFLLH